MKTDIFAGILLKPGQHNYVAMTALSVEADDDIKQISPERRNCYFPDENPLEMHKVYSQANCILECSIKYARQCPFTLKLLSSKTCHFQVRALQAECSGNQFKFLDLYTVVLPCIRPTPDKHL